MKTWIFSFTILLLLFACSDKKKAMLLIPPGLGSSDTPSVTTQATVSTVAEVPFTVASLDATDPNQISTSSTATTSTPTTVSATTTTAVVSQTTSNGGFSYETNVTVPVTVHIVNVSGPVADAPVTVFETQVNGETNVLGQGTTNAEGDATLPVFVPPTLTQVIVSVVGVNPTTGEVQEVTGSIPVQIPAPSSGAGSTAGTVIVSPTVSLTTNNFQPAKGCVAAIDTDCDSVANLYDEFSDDAASSSTARSGRYTIAFEDSYPKAGNADMNDHTSVFSTEMDKAPDNKVKVLRATVTQVAKGPGADHELRLKLDVPVGAKVEVSYLDGSGKPWTGCAAAPKYVDGTGGDCTGGSLSSAQLKTGLLIIPNAFKSGGNKQNTGTNGRDFTANDFVRGITANVSITFDQAVDLSTAKNTVGGHLNWFLATSNKSKGVYEQIFRPGFVFGANGQDLYVDTDLFPWAIIVPGVFNHPVNSADIRKASTTGYAYFAAWANSKGTQHKDWYTQITDPSKVVNISSFYTENGFSAYLIKAVYKNSFEVSASLIMIGAVIMGFLMKKRISKKTA